MNQQEALQKIREIISLMNEDELEEVLQLVKRELSNTSIANLHAEENDVLPDSSIGWMDD